MESTHFYFAIMVSLVLVVLGWAVAATAAVGYSLLGLGFTVAGLAMANLYMASVSQKKLVPVPVRKQNSRSPIIYQ